MPKLDGKDATRAIRALEGNKDTPVPIVALTAHAMDGEEAAIMAAGLNHYLTKPLSKDALEKQVLAAWSDGLQPPVPHKAMPLQVSG